MWGGGGGGRGGEGRREGDTGDSMRGCGVEDGGCYQEGCGS